MKQTIRIMSTLALTSLFIHSAAADIRLQAQSFKSLPGWKNDQQNQAIGALKKSCHKLLKRRCTGSASMTCEVSWQNTCRKVVKLGSLSANSARQFIENNFIPYQITDNGNKTGLFTGYYEPTVLASFKRTPYFGVPIYGKPRNLTKTTIDGKRRTRIKVNGQYKMMPSRAEISASKNLLPNTPVIAWVHSKVDRAFLQIQGSGSLLMPNASRIMLGYAGQNGHPYRPIGRYLLKAGALKPGSITMQSIRKWLDDNPKKVTQVLNYDPSFVFFRLVKSDQPIGAQGIALTPERSLAIDRRYYPLGAPMWLSTELPALPDINQSSKKWQQLLIAQDTGGAIKGPIRGDVFWGEGKRASMLAGHLQAQGQLWILLPKGVSPKGIG